MNKSFCLLITALFVLLLSFTSCKESSGIDEYADWQARNDSYLSFIAGQAKANEGEGVGKWKIIRSYLLDPDVSGTDVNLANYVYARINRVGTGTQPYYSDSVSICYRGNLINGVLFENTPAFVPKNSLSTDTLFADKPNDSYGDIFKHVIYYPDLDVLIPANLRLAELIVGWQSVLSEMKEGDYWTLYIPSQLAYGDKIKTNAMGMSIPANSMLIYDLYLIRTYLK